MKLISLKLNGQYKGLKDQHFDFSKTQENVIALIGLNGSGKSQLLELIAEIFAFLERCQRSDFKIRTPIGFGFELEYQCLNEYDIQHTHYRTVLKTTSKLPHIGCFKKAKGTEFSKEHAQCKDTDWIEESIENLPLPNIVGYSSGLNENLQRSFMKNAVQYFDVMTAKLNRYKLLKTPGLDDEGMSELNHRFLFRYPHIFEPVYQEPYYDARDTYGQYTEEEKKEIRHNSLLLSLKEYPTPLSKLIYIDYDSIGLALASLALLPKVQIEKLFKEIRFKYPQKLVLHYFTSPDWTGYEEIKDIQRLIRIVGKENLKGLSRKTTSKEYDSDDLDYLSGEITFDFTSPIIIEKLNSEFYGNQLRFFKLLYRLQQLGVKNWQASSKRNLRKDNFLNTVKKPLQTKLPLSVKSLTLANDDGDIIDFNDLSDGEAQLIQILATAKLFHNENTLFLLDEPETHLNPLWRTFFHSYLTEALALPADNEGDNLQLCQVMLSTHSPFMISSLKQENVLFFERDKNGLVQMQSVDSQTYGASFDVLIKQHFGLRSLISQTVVEEIRNQLQQGSEHAREWISENLGMSAEKAHLMRKLDS